MEREITVKISKKNFLLLKKTASADKTVDTALKQFFIKNHKMKIRMLLKRGYKSCGKRNLRLCRPLPEDTRF